MSKTIYIGGRLESKEKGNVITGANAILDDTKGKKQNVINKETDDELLRLEQSKQDNLNFDNAPTENSTNPVTSGGVYTAEKALSDAIEAILLLIPSAATALNKLVDTNTMNSSISTATATFRGTYNAVSDLGLTYQATHAQIEAALDALGLTADNNDFVFVQIPVSDESQDIAKTERFKFNGTNWLYEYDLNTSGFTASQWAAINSTITLALVQKLVALPTNAELLQALGLKQDVLTFDNAPTTDSNNPVKSGGIKNAIDTAVGNEAEARDNADTALNGLIDDEKTRAEGVEGGLDTRLGAVEGSVSTIQGVIPSEATSSNKLVDNSSMTTYIGTIIDNIDATFNVTSTDGHVTLAITQVNGAITSVQLTTSDIASAAALNLKASQADLNALANRVTTTEGNITTINGNISSLSGRVSDNETDIETLRALYNSLQQSAPQVIQPTDTWPVANPSTTVIYRVIDRVNTPPQYYSDYMWNGTAFVLMATYNNAIDDVPTAGSNNLVKSGGVLNSTIQHRDMLLVDPDFTAESNRVWYKFGNTTSELEPTYDPYRLRTVPIPVKEGQTFDVYTIAQTAADTVPSIVPLDDNFNPIINEVVQSSYTAEELIHYTASANAKYIICIAHAGTSPYPYVKCTSSGTVSKEISEIKSAINSNKTDIENIDKTLNSNRFGGVPVNGTLMNGYYIDDNGNISDAADSYNLVKVALNNFGVYYIGKDLYNDHPVLAKYTDNTYSQVEKIIISFAATQSFWQELSPGYYAICSVNKVPEILDVDNIVNGLFESRYKGKGNIPGINSLDKLDVSTWTKISDGVYESSLQNIGFSSGMFMPYETYEDSFFLKAVITPITAVNGNFEFMLAKAPRSSEGGGGTGVIITKDGTSKILSIGHFNGIQFQSCATASLSGIRFDVNRRLSVVLEKHIDERIWFSVSVTDDAGNVVEIPKVYDYIEDGEHAIINAGLGLGQVIIAANVGQWKAEDFSFGYRKNPDTIKLAVMGHSFVAGQNSTIFNMDKRFAALLANDIGIDETLIFGFGGGDYHLFNSFKKQISWYQNVKYALICLGTNDADTSTVCQQYQDFDTFLKANNTIPIWLTISPHRDDGQLHPVLNAYIKANFNFVDIEQIFYNDNGTINTSMFYDEVHPSITGYDRMYKIIISQMTQFVM